MRRRLAVAVIAALALAGCSAQSTDAAPEWEGAHAAVEAYVAAIEAGDLAAATAMSDESALEPPANPNAQVVDVTAALPDAVEPMTDQWITFVGADVIAGDEDGDDPTYTDVTWWSVSFAVGETVGEDEVAVTRTGDDPADPASWTVTDGLLVESATYVDLQTIEAFTVGGSVEILAGESAHHAVWGYPGVYLQEASAFTDDAPDGTVAEPVEVHLGVEVEARWDEQLPTLEAAAA